MSPGHVSQHCRVGIGSSLMRSAAGVCDGTRRSTVTPQPGSSEPRRAMNLRVLVLVALITAFAPLSMDLYLPGLPDLRADLGASDQQAQMTVTLCIVGLALGQFWTSLIPDRFGRRRPLVVGMTGWVIATVLCALAPNITAILALRLCQGLGAGVAIALARTVVADLDPDNLS